MSLNKTIRVNQFLLSSGCVDIAIRMHNMVANKMNGEKLDDN